MKTELKTDRLTLRPVSENDFEHLQRIFTDEFVRRFLFDDEILEAGQIRDFVSVSDRTFAESDYGLWLIVLDKMQKEIGFAGLWHFFDEPRPQLLYALLPEHAGQGFALEAARRIVEFAFSELNFQCLDASCDLPNTASQRVAEKLGMTKFKETAVNGLPILFFRLENR